MERMEGSLTRQGSKFLKIKKTILQTFEHYYGLGIEIRTALKTVEEFILLGTLLTLIAYIGIQMLLKTAENAPKITRKTKEILSLLTPKTSKRTSQKQNPKETQGKDNH